MRYLSLLLCLSIGIGSMSGQVLLEQDFNEGPLDPTIWNYREGNGCPQLCGWGNNEPQLYDKPSVAIADGQLQITTSIQGANYHSGRINTKGKFEFQYGTVEARAKVPRGTGLWPALWMLGNDIDTNTWPGCGEIDILEYVGREPGEIFTTLHIPASYGSNPEFTKKTKIPNVEDEFHVYKMTWTEESISFFFDDQLLYEYNPEVKNDATWPFDKPFFLIVNMAIGGNFGGPVIDDSSLPATFAVDYIKVYQ